MNPRIVNIGKKNLVGKKMEMSLAENKTAELWRSFMPMRKLITNSINDDLFSMQIYDSIYFSDFNPEKNFVKWATTEVTSFENIPEIFETFVLPAGLYAVFHHKGTDTGIFQAIFTEWLPKSGYLLDNRPHFEVLGEKYKNGSPDSEEEIWIPIKQKNKIIMEQRINFITLGVNDLEKSIDFYENKFGWKRSPLSTGDIVFFELNGFSLSLYPREELAKDATVESSGSGFKSFTLAHNARSEEDVDAQIKTLREKGVTIVKEPQKVFWGGYSSYIADPDGFLWEIAFNPFLKID
jgi:predicted transcriptional regulator YdeE/catechol 2,3-dioxygenase-like lactoylglutathione lyase family enzyme